MFLQQEAKVASVLGLFFRVFRAILHDSCKVRSRISVRNGTVDCCDSEFLGKPFGCCVLPVRNFPPSKEQVEKEEENQKRRGSEIGLDLIS